MSLKIRLANSVSALHQRYRAILGQGVWAITGQGLTVVFTLAGARLITEYVDPGIYGAVSLIQNGVLLLRAFFCSPILGAALRFYPGAENGHYVAALRQMLVRTLAVALITIEVIVVVGGAAWVSQKGVRVFVVFALVLYAFADVIRTIEITLFGAARRQRPVAIYTAFETMLRPIVVVGGVIVLGASIEVVLGAMAISIVMTVMAIYAFYGLRSSDDNNPIPPSVVMEIKKFAIPLIPVAVLNWTTSLSDRYIIEWLTHDSASVGIYAAGYALVSQPLIVTQGVILMVLRPVYFAAVSRGDALTAKRTIRTWFAGCAGACVVTAIIIVLSRRYVVDAFLGRQYRAAVGVFPWIALGYVLFAVEQVFEQKLLASNRTFAVLVAQISGALASIAVTIPLVKIFGMIGAAYACPVYFAVQCVVAARMVRGSSD